MELSTILQNYGLTDKEAKVYLACLSVGSGSVQSISKLANIARSTTYEILAELQNKGLVATFNKKKVLYFSAENPQSIIVNAKEKARLLEEALPGFMALYNSTDSKPSVRFYEGQHNLNIVWKEILREAEQIKVISAVDDLVTKLGAEFQDFLKKRVAKNISAQSILQDTPSTREFTKQDAMQLRTSKLAPVNYIHHSVVMLWNDKVAVLNIGKDYNLLIIEGQDISLFFNATFNLLWSMLPEI